MPLGDDAIGLIFAGGVGCVLLFVIIVMLACTIYNYREEQKIKKRTMANYLPYQSQQIVPDNNNPAYDGYILGNYTPRIINQLNPQDKFIANGSIRKGNDNIVDHVLVQYTGNHTRGENHENSHTQSSYFPHNCMIYGDFLTGNRYCSSPSSRLDVSNINTHLMSQNGTQNFISSQFSHNGCLLNNNNVDLPKPNKITQLQKVAVYEVETGRFRIPTDEDYPKDSTLCSARKNKVSQDFLDFNNSNDTSNEHHSLPNENDFIPYDNMKDNTKRVIAEKKYHNCVKHEPLSEINKFENRNEKGTHVESKLNSSNNRVKQVSFLDPETEEVLTPDKGSTLEKNEETNSFEQSSECFYGQVTPRDEMGERKTNSISATANSFVYVHGDEIDQNGVVSDNDDQVLKAKKKKVSTKTKDDSSALVQVEVHYVANKNTSFDPDTSCEPVTFVSMMRRRSKDRSNKNNPELTVADDSSQFKIVNHVHSDHGEVSPREYNHDDFPELDQSTSARNISFRTAFTSTPRANVGEVVNTKLEEQNLAAISRVETLPPMSDVVF